MKLLPSPAAEQKSASARLQQRVEAAAACHQGEDFRRLALACERASQAWLWFMMRVPLHPSCQCAHAPICAPLCLLSITHFPVAGLSLRAVAFISSSVAGTVRLGLVPGVLGRVAGPGAAPSHLFLGARGTQGCVMGKGDVGFGYD